MSSPWTQLASEVNGLCRGSTCLGSHRLALLQIAAIVAAATGAPTPCCYVPPPPVSPATGLENRVYQWRSQKIRYQVGGESNIGGPSVILVHGMFANCDHWRRTIGDLSGAGCRVFALDLLGYGYSSKPPPRDNDSFDDWLNGESRFELDLTGSSSTKRQHHERLPSILKGVRLGTANGGVRKRDINLRHPLGSCYNFYTWAEQLQDFARDVVLCDERSPSKATLVGNSIGSIVAMQAVMDCPNMFNGVFVLTPTFRSMHHAEVPFERVSMPMVRVVQQFLRTKGRGLYNLLAKPSAVRKILMEPYAVSSAVDDHLVDALLTPLLVPGGREVVLDALSYSAGPLPEQQLSTFPSDVPVWIAYGTADPWTPGARVESMADRFASVERVIPLDGVGHCPHDEAPEVVNPLLLEFIDKVGS